MENAFARVIDTPVCMCVCLYTHVYMYIVFLRDFKWKTEELNEKLSVCIEIVCCMYVYVLS